MRVLFPLSLVVAVGCGPSAVKPDTGGIDGDCSLEHAFDPDNDDLPVSGARFAAESGSCGEDAHRWRVTTEVGDVLIGLFSATEGTPRAFVTDAQDTQIASLSQIATGEAIVADGTDLYVHVVDLEPGDRYTLEIQPSSLGCTADSAEPNDAANASYQLNAGVHSGFNLCPGDTDFFAVPTNGGARVDITVPGNSIPEIATSMACSDATGTLDCTQTMSTVDTAITVQVDKTILAPFVTPKDVAAASFDYSLDIASTAFSCSDLEDSFEDNDTRITATALTGGPTGNLHSCSGDTDYFSFTAYPGDTIDFDVAFDAAEGDVLLQLHAPTANSVASVTTSPGLRSLSYTALESGTYFAEVVLGSDTGALPGASYSTDLTVTTATICLEDAHEPNDSNSTSTTTASFPATARACDQNDDWYTVSVPETAVLTVDLAFPHAEGDLGLAVYDPSTQPPTLLGDSTSTTDDEQVVLNDLPAGDYLIAVTMVTDTGPALGNDYRLSYDVFAACPDDAQEPNDDVGSAVTVTPGTVSGLEACSDADWFAFTVSTIGEQIDLAVTFDDAEGDAVLRLDSPSGTDVATVTTGTGTAALSHVAPEIGTWYAVVTSANDGGTRAGTPYALDLDIGPQTCNQESQEPNDDAGSAALLPAAPPTATACTGDSDWWQVDIPAGQLQIDATFSHADGDINIEVFESGGTASLGAGTSTTDDEQVIVGNLPAGSYLVEVTLPTDTGLIVGADYTLRARTTSATGCPIDLFEPNDAQVTAAALTPGLTSALSACGLEDDWYTFDVLTGDIVDVTVDFAAAEGDVDIQLTDGTNVLATGTTGASGETLTYTATANATLFLEVTLASDAGTSPGNDYSIDLVVTAPSTCDITTGSLSTFRGASHDSLNFSYIYFWDSLTAPLDTWSIEFWYGFGSPTAVTGAVTHTFYGENYQTCGYCGTMCEDFDGTTCAAVWTIVEGDLVITRNDAAVGGRVEGTITDIVFQEMDSNSDPLVGGDTWCIPGTVSFSQVYQ